MAEESNRKAELVEKNAKYLFNKLFGWEYVHSNFDINKNKDGVDIYFKLFDPLFNEEIAPVIECKFREKYSEKELFSFISTLKKKIQRIPTSKRFEKLSYIEEIKNSLLNFGIIFLHYNYFEINNYFNSIKSFEITEKVQSKYAPSIFLMTNNKIKFFYDFIKNKKEKNLEFYYPIFANNKRKEWSKILSLSYLFSDVIIGRYNSGDNLDKKTFIISFETFSEENFNYLYKNIAGGLQIMEEISEIIFVQESNFDDFDLRSAYEEKFNIKIINKKYNVDLPERFEEEN